MTLKASSMLTLLCIVMVLRRRLVWYKSRRDPLARNASDCAMNWLTVRAQ